MPQKFNTPLSLVSLSSPPTSPAPVNGEMYFDTTVGRVGFYQASSSSWVYPASPGVLPTASSAPSGYPAGKAYYDTTYQAIGVSNGSNFIYQLDNFGTSGNGIGLTVTTPNNVTVTFTASLVTLDEFAAPQHNVSMNGYQLTSLILEVLSSAPTTNVTAGRTYYDSTIQSIGFYNGTSWVYPARGKGNPAGRVYAAAGMSYTTSQAAITTTSTTTSFLSGGMTSYSSTSVGLVAPISGYYQVNGCVYSVTASGNRLTSSLITSSGAVSIGNSAVSTAAGAILESVVTDVIYLAAGASVQLGAAGTATSYSYSSNVNYLSASLVGS